ncbi:MAG: hypothetical protein DLM54_04180 [Acidimicrobiales bacterium]|nr:MAG: hypothetical protein DLM54_04180 [Acidimicrobiales bacterium]
MPAGFDTISFLSDYGLDDEFVGVVKAVIRGIAPAATVIDVTHGVATHDVRAGSLVLARSIQYLPPGVVLAVVDPGVGGVRRAVAVEVGNDNTADHSILVGPDNGLLAPAVALAGGAPANFLDAGGGSKAEAITSAVQVILSDPKVKAVLCNIFGGITRCDEVAKGLIEAFRQIDPQVPFVVRLDGTNGDEGRALLGEANLAGVYTEATMDGAAARVVELASAGAAAANGGGRSG